MTTRQAENTHAIYNSMQAKLRSQFKESGCTKWKSDEQLSVDDIIHPYLNSASLQELIRNVHMSRPDILAQVLT